MNQAALDFYARPGRYTDLDEAHVGATTVEEIVEVVRGLLIYDVVAQSFYGVELSALQAEAIHERESIRLIECALVLDDRPITMARAPADRVGARCHAFSRLTVALLRSVGIPARARCGFGSYFRPGYFEDHWVAEYWNAPLGTWVMVDAQLDEVWRDKIGFDGDSLAITSQQFVSAGHAWRAWRNGEMDAARCGLSGINEHGAFWIAGNLRLDLASLNKVEMLPWDVWGAHWGPHEEATVAQLELFDAIAELTIEPDEHFDDLRRAYETNDMLRMDASVVNVLRGQVEIV